MSSVRTTTRLMAVFSLAGVLTLAMCGGSESANTVHVSGTVTFAGKPLPIGMIVFEPDASKGNRGLQGHADIRDGKFDTRVSKKGA